MKQLGEPGTSVTDVPGSPDAMVNFYHCFRCTGLPKYDYSMIGRCKTCLGIKV
jgi:hypothetical protein